LNHQTAERRVGNGRELAIRMVIYNHYFKIKEKQLSGAQRILYFLIQWECNYAMNSLM